MLKKSLLALAVLIYLLALPGLIAGLWYGVDPALLWLFLGYNLFFLTLNAMGLAAKPAPETRAVAKRPLETPAVEASAVETPAAAQAGPGQSILISALVYGVLFLGPPFVAAVSAYAWYELRGPYGFQYEYDFTFLRYVAEDRSFELQYPQDWKTLMPHEAAAKTQSALVPTAAARLFVGNPDDWMQNMNIQIASAPMHDGKIVGDDKWELEALAKQMRVAVRRSDPTARVATDSVEEVDGIYRLYVVITKDVLGNRIRQSSTMFIVNGKLVTITATAPDRIFRGLNTHRFEKMAASFRLPAAAR